MSGQQLLLTGPMVSLNFLLVFFFFVNVAVVDVIEDIRTEDIVPDHGLPFGEFHYASLFLSVDVHVVHTRHQDEELFEVKTSEFQVVFHLSEDHVQHSHSQFLTRSFRVLSSLF
jgi:hypothetical protein